MLAIGRGEQLSPLPDIQPIPLLLCKHKDLSDSTAWAYQNYSAESARGRGPISPMLSAIAHQDPPDIAQHLYNDLETVVLPFYPQVAQLKETLLNSQETVGTLGSMMSGSGPTVFALLPDLEAAATLKSQLEAAYPNIEFWLTRTSLAGISVVEGASASL